MITYAVAVLFSRIAWILNCYQGFIKRIILCRAVAQQMGKKCPKYGLNLIVVVQIHTLRYTFGVSAVLRQLPHRLLYIMSVKDQ